MLLIRTASFCIITAPACPRVALHHHNPYHQIRRSYFLQTDRQAVPSAGIAVSISACNSGFLTKSMSTSILASFACDPLTVTDLSQVLTAITKSQSYNSLAHISVSHLPTAPDLHAIQAGHLLHHTVRHIVNSQHLT